MRSPLGPFLVFSGILALAAACGGKTAGVGGNGSSSGASSSGASSSGGSSGGNASSSGGSGGGSGGSSGGISGSSGSSSGGVTCAPLPGCDSSVECPSPDGCGGYCTCEDGDWTCSAGGCGDDTTDASLPDSGVCPDNPVTPGANCDTSGSCDWSFGNGCSETCYCSDYQWVCDDICSSSACPVVAPEPETACSSIGSTCDYTVSFCGEECTCDPSGSWSCATYGCIDAGPPDTGVVETGPPDTGIVDDAGAFCPTSQPATNTACSDLGDVCTYFSSCETNCLCASSGWVCATVEGCTP